MKSNKSKKKELVDLHIQIIDVYYNSYRLFSLCVIPIAALNASCIGMVLLVALPFLSSMRRL